MDLLGTTREEDGRLSGRVTAADHGDRCADAEPLLHEGRLVVDPVALEVLEPLDRQAPIVGAAGDHERPRLQRRPVFERDRLDTRRGVRGRPRARRRRSGHRTCGPGSSLVRPARRRRSPAGSRGSSRSGRRCSPGRRRRSHRRPRCQALGGAVDRRRQAGRPGADDDEIAEAVARLLPHADRRRQLGVARVAPYPAAPDDDRRLLGRHPEPLEERLGAVVALRVDPAERKPVACGEVAEAPGVREVARADDLQPGADATQQLATLEEGAQHQVAERRIFADELAQRLRRRPGGPSRERGRPPCRRPAARSTG